MQVLLQFAIDDTAGGENEDALTEIGFFVPKEAASFQDGQEHPAKVGIGSLLPMQDQAMQVLQNFAIIYALSIYPATAASCTGGLTLESFSDTGRRGIVCRCCTT